MEGENCVDLIQIAILANPTSLNMLYLLEFSMDTILGGIQIGEVVFRDETSIKFSFVTKRRDICRTSFFIV